MSVDTIADTVHVRIVGGSVWGDTANLVEVASLGVSDGPAVDMLGRVGSLAVSPSGEIYLVDAQVPALRKYDADGRWQVTLGRIGGGPGEYRQPDGGLAVLSDGRVVLRDPGNSRLVVYGPEGDFLDQWPLNVGGFASPRKLYRTRDDRLHSMVFLDTDRPPTQWNAGLTRYAPDGTVIDTLAIPDLHYAPPTVHADRDGRTSVFAVPFSPKAPWTLSSDGDLIVGIGEQYRFTVLREAAPRVIERDVAPVATTVAEREDQEHRLTWMMQRFFPGWRWNGPPIPEVKPAYTSLFAGEAGRIWVVAATPGIRVANEDEAEVVQDPGARPAPRFREPVVFDLFESDGRYLGRVLAPAGLQVRPEPVIRGDTVWAVHTDPDLGTPRVVRYLVTHGT